MVTTKLKSELFEEDVLFLAGFLGKEHNMYGADPNRLMKYFSTLLGREAVWEKAVSDYFVLQERGGKRVLVTPNGNLLKAFTGEGETRFLSLVISLAQAGS